MVRMQRFTQMHLAETAQAELDVVDELAKQLRQHLTACEEELATAHVHGASSHAIQSLVGSLLVDELGFESELPLATEVGLSVRPRPDFIYRLATGRGVIAEVERGGTTTNNHDLKDMWKAHLSPDTHHLFLIVPMNNWKPDGSPREKVYPAVVRRIGAFFGDPRREIDVASVHIFGY
jgi:hypothetical protein